MAKKLRTGFTTGTAAAAAAKGALICLLTGTAPARVTVRLLTGDDISIPLHRCRRLTLHTATCSVIKDAGDDPDVTHNAEIGATVTLHSEPCNASSGLQKHPALTITAGDGVGRVTRPGLAVPPGEPAINPGPRQMIRQAVDDVLQEYLCRHPISVAVFVPEGRRLAEKTLNARLGILGGISILGTTGIVRPMSHEAFTATIRAALSVARASGLQHAVLTTGRRSERYAQMYWPQRMAEGFIQIGDFFKMALEYAAELAFKEIALAVFFGKAIKMAQGAAHTHAGSARLNLNVLSQWSRKITRDRTFSQAIAAANTARHAFEMIRDKYPQVIFYVGWKITTVANSFSAATLNCHSVIFDYDGAVVFDSAQQQRMTIR